MEEKFDYYYKIVTMGESGVGKTSFLNRVARNRFDLVPMYTIGVDFRTLFTTVGASRVKLQLWDTAGQERFRAITSAYYRNAQGVILVFDVTKRASFDRLLGWLGECASIAEIPGVLVANKIDLPDRVVTTHEAMAFAAEHRLFYAEVSCAEYDQIQLRQLVMDPLVERVHRQFAPAMSSRQQPTNPPRAVARRTNCAPCV